MIHAQFGKQKHEQNKKIKKKRSSNASFALCFHPLLHWITDIFIIGRIFRSIFMKNIMSKHQSEMFVVVLRHRDTH